MAKGDKKLKNDTASKEKHFRGYFLPNNVVVTSIIGIFAALICVLTMMIPIPIPATQGYINIGDAAVVISGLLFGPLIGGLSGGIGSALADIFLNYPIYAPATLIIKGLEGFLVGIIANPKKLKSDYRDILGVLIGGFTMVIGYFLYEIILWGFEAALIEVILNGSIQFGLGAFMSLFFAFTSRKTIVDNLPNVFNKVFVFKPLETDLKS